MKFGEAEVTGICGAKDHREGTIRKVVPKMYIGLHMRWYFWLRTKLLMHRARMHEAKQRLSIEEQQLQSLSRTIPTVMQGREIF